LRIEREAPKRSLVRLPALSASAPHRSAADHR
jgi:hypothetical protein